ncbi:MAG: hypothetical protein HGB10_06005 [Coriobacteriia bacterium]|nr:hypothetical protein [Coriobacteriia bacterium]
MFKRALFAAIGATTALAVGAAGAYFTAQVQVPDSVIRAGSVAISTLPTSSPLAVEALAPGTTEVRPMAVVNDGAIASDVIVTAKKSAGITEFYDALDCTVTCGGTPLYAGDLAALRTLPLRLSPGARGELRFEVGLPASVGNSLAEDYAKVSLYVDAEQAHE